MKKKLLIYIVAFNHEKFIEKVVDRIDDKIFGEAPTRIETLKLVGVCSDKLRLF